MDNIGWVQSSPTVDSTRLPCSEVDGSDADASGSYDSGGYWVFDDSSIELDPSFTNTFKVRIDLENAGEHVAEQIVTRAANWAFTTNGCSVDAITRTAFNEVELECSVTDYVNILSLTATFTDGLNDKMPNYNTGLTFETQEVEDGTVLIAGQSRFVRFKDTEDNTGEHTFEINPGISEADVLYDPANKISSSAWELYKNNTKVAGGSSTDNDPTFTETSSFETSGGDNWKLALYDDSGTFIDAVTWTWGGSDHPYDDGDSGGDQYDYSTRSSDQQASSVNDPVTIT